MGWPPFFWNSNSRKGFINFFQHPSPLRSDIWRHFPLQNMPTEIHCAWCTKLLYLQYFYIIFFLGLIGFFAWLYLSESVTISTPIKHDKQKQNHKKRLWNIFSGTTPFVLNNDGQTTYTRSLFLTFLCVFYYIRYLHIHNIILTYDIISYDIFIHKFISCLLLHPFTIRIGSPIFQHSC